MSEAPTYANLEIRILKSDDQGYPVELKVDGGQEFQGGYLGSDIVPWTATASPEEDGEALFNKLFADDQLLQGWAQIRGQSKERRIRLRIDASAPELHAIPWELLRDSGPEQTLTLSAANTTPFSRYLAGQWEATDPITNRPVKVLVAIANPEDLEDYDLAPIDVDREKKVIQEAFSDLGGDQLELAFLDENVSLPAIETALKEGYHILHLIAHGRFRKRRGVASLYLTDNYDQVRLINEAEFAEMIQRQARAPQLIFLASCESASRSPADAFRGFAPTLISAGVPAVIAMQDLMPMATAQNFTGTFYHRLLDHGQVDLACNEARSAVLTADLPGGSVPVLFSRLPDNILFAAVDPEELIQSEFPPPEPARPPLVSELVGRETELVYFADKLAEGHLAVVSGMAGVGKTSLAASLTEVWRCQQMLSPEASEVLAEESASEEASAAESTPGDETPPSEEGVSEDEATAESETQDEAPLEDKVILPDDRQTKVFWHIFHENDGLLEMSRKLAGFLAWHGQPDIWHMVESARQKDEQMPPQKELLDYIFQEVRERGYLICWDDIQHVEEDPYVEHMMQLVDELTQSGEVSVIMTSRQAPKYIQLTDFKPLAGLDISGTQAMATALGLDLTENQVEALYKYTEGNPQLMTMAVDVLKQAKEPDIILSRLDKAEGIESYLMDEVDAGLTDEDRQVMIAVAIFKGFPSTRYAIEKVGKLRRLKKTILGLHNRHLLTVQQSEEAELYNAPTIIRAFYYDEPGPDELRAMHRLAADYYTSAEPDTLKAVRHYIWAEDYDQAIQRATDDVLGLINAGRARPLSKLLLTLVEQTLEPTPSAIINLALGEVYGFLGERDLAKENYEKVLSASDTLANSEEMPELLAKACRGLSDLGRYESPQEAMELLARGLEILGEADSAEKPTLLLKMSTLQVMKGDYETALATIEQGMAGLSESDYWLRTGALMNLGMVYSYQGDLEQAIEVTAQALEISNKSYNYFQMVAILNNLGYYKMRSGDWAGAIEPYKEALKLAQKLGIISHRVTLGNNLGFLYMRQGLYESAANIFKMSLTLAREHNLRSGELEVTISLVELHLIQEDWEAARTQAAEAEQLALALEANDQLAVIYRQWSQLYLAEEAPDKAADYIQQSLDAARQGGMRLEEGISQRVLGEIHLAKGQSEAALEAFEQSFALLQDKNRYQAACTQLAWGRHLVAEAEGEQGRTLLQTAKETFEALGAERELAMVTEVLT